MEVYTLDSGEYPKLKQHKRTKRIVLFTSPKTGTQLNDISEKEGCSPERVGYTYNGWFEDEYEPFTGTVILGGSSE